MFSARMNWNKVLIGLDVCFYFISFHIIRFAEVFFLLWIKCYISCYSLSHCLYISNILKIYFKCIKYFKYIYISKSTEFCLVFSDSQWREYLVLVFSSQSKILKDSSVFSCCNKVKLLVENLAHVNKGK